MSTDNSTIKGKFDQSAGTVKQAVGETVHNQSLANEGAAQQIKGHAEEVWGSIKEATHDTKERKQPTAEHDAHDIRESITSTAQNVKEHIQAGVDNFKNRDKENAA